MGPQLFRLAEAVTAHNQHRSLTVSSIKCGVQAISNTVKLEDFLNENRLFFSSFLLNVPNPDEFPHQFFSFFRYINRRRFYAVSECFGSGSALILIGWIQDPQRENGSRRAEMTNKNIPKVKKFRVLKYWMYVLF